MKIQLEDSEEMLKEYEQLIDQRGLQRPKAPVWHGRTINTSKIFHAVQKHGGFMEVGINLQ